MRSLIAVLTAAILLRFHQRSRRSAVDPNPLPFLERNQPDHYLELALKEARKALESDEVPVGAVIVDMPTGRIIARAHNQREMLQDPTAHAEVIAITQAAAHYGAWRLSDAALFVTLEPCLMCAGAIVQARIPKVYYGAEDPKAGAHRSVFQVLAHSGNNHVPEVVFGIRAPESGELLREFFRAKRAKSPSGNGL
jgi:tRNA(adenine34) deaminase